MVTASRAINQFKEISCEAPSFVHFFHLHTHTYTHKNLLIERHLPTRIVVIYTEILRNNSLFVFAVIVFATE